MNGSDGPCCVRESARERGCPDRGRYVGLVRGMFASSWEVCASACDLPGSRSVVRPDPLGFAVSGICFCMSCIKRQ